jgi:hypothetical protein
MLKEEQRLRCCYTEDAQVALSLIKMRIDQEVDDLNILSEASMETIKAIIDSRMKSQRARYMQTMRQLRSTGRSINRALLNIHDQVDTQMSNIVDRVGRGDDIDSLLASLGRVGADGARRGD